MGRLKLQDRIKQVTFWLEEYFPTPYPVSVKWCKDIPLSDGEDGNPGGHFAECYYSKPNIIIRLSKRKNRDVAIALDSLLHEWAHAATMPNTRVYNALEKSGSLQDHPEEFWVVYGKIYRSFYDEGGSGVSRDYAL